MDATTAIVVGVVLVLVIAAAVYWQYDRSRRLRARYGAEYSRAVEETGGRRKAEAELHAREKRVHDLDIRPLGGEARARYLDDWRRVQAEFVDAPETAITDADRLVGAVMQDMGYPIADFDQRAADLSVKHADVVENYRTAHAIALAHQRGQAGTEDLRQAMIHYRELFEDLVGGSPRRGPPADHQEERHVRH
jgi:hypothetical protein